MKNLSQKFYIFSQNVFYLVLLLLSLLFHSCQSTGPIRLVSESIIQILPLGDSRVDGGRPVFESYRYELWKNLVNAGIEDFDFIGAIEDDAVYEDFNGQAFNLNHQGISGATTDFILETAQRLAKGGNVGDIVLLGIGGNDIIDKVHTPKETLENIHNIIDVLQKANEKVIIFLEQIAPGRSDYMSPEVTILINEFNAGILDVARIQNTSSTPETYTQPMTASRLIPVQMDGDWKDEFMADEVHYSEIGAKIIADRNFNVMKRFFGGHGSGYYFGNQGTSYSKGGAMVYSGVSFEGNTFFYPNPLETDGVDKFNQGVCGRSPWFDTSCCPVNVVRVMPSLPGYIYSARGKDVFVNLFIGNNAKLEVDGEKLGIRQQTNYPWNGKVNFSFENPQGANARLNIRIPGWPRNQVLPGDLYHYASPKELAFSLKVNGRKEKPVVSDGYIQLEERSRKKGDSVEITFEMEIRKLKSNDKVVSNRGKVALERGPLVYCAEAIDNGGRVLDLSLPSKGALEYSYDPTVLGGLGIIKGDAMRAGKQTTLTAIPYYAWAHREIGEMAVWLNAN